MGKAEIQQLACGIIAKAFEDEDVKISHVRVFKKIIEATIFIDEATIYLSQLLSIKEGMASAGINIDDISWELLTTTGSTTGGTPATGFLMDLWMTKEEK